MIKSSNQFALIMSQWLGNVVTCDWWSELWIQEGHANFYEHRTTAFVQPTWDTVGQGQIVLHLDLWSNIYCICQVLERLRLLCTETASLLAEVSYC
jgi:hypothetical protein